MTEPLGGRLLQEVLRQQEVAAHKKYISKKVSGAAALAMATQFLWTQFIVWGLASFGIAADYWAVWMMLQAFFVTVLVAVRIGMMTAVRDTRN